MKAEVRIVGALIAITRNGNSFAMVTKESTDDLIAQLRAAAETVWPEPVPCHGSRVLCGACDGYGGSCHECAGSGENWKYEGGVVAKWYAGPLKTLTEKSNDQ